jgi:hypothetical protein
LELDPSVYNPGQSPEDRAWYTRIPCKYGFIGIHSETGLMAYCSTSRLFGPLLAIRGVQVKQRSDRDANVVFPPEAFEQVATLLRARKRRPSLSEGRKRSLVAAGASLRYGSQTEGHDISTDD